jgi:hypothetical protein
LNNNKEFQYNYRSQFESGSKDGILYQKLYLHSFETDLFKDKWEKFVLKDLSMVDNAIVRDSIREVMTFYNPVTKQSYYNIPIWSYIYNKGHKFYRVRRIIDKEINIPPDEMKQWGDIWAPPNEFVQNYGRLNYPAESLLYTAADNPIIAINELKLKDGEPFILITYEAKEDFIVTIVGYHQERSYLTEEENEKSKSLTDFFSDIFTKEIKEDNEHLYKITSNLIKECYTIDDESQLGWVYPSIANKKGRNVCFKPEKAKDKLNVTGVELCKVDANYGFVINYVLDDLDVNSEFTYHLIGSEVQKKKCPQINKID